MRSTIAGSSDGPAAELLPGEWRTEGKRARVEAPAPGAPASGCNSTCLPIVPPHATPRRGIRNCGYEPRLLSQVWDMLAALAEGAVGFCSLLCFCGCKAGNVRKRDPHCHQRGSLEI